jgi:hypothetical protein
MYEIVTGQNVGQISAGKPFLRFQEELWTDNITKIPLSCKQKPPVEITL